MHACFPPQEVIGTPTAFIVIVSMAANQCICDCVGLRARDVEIRSQAEHFNSLSSDNWGLG